MRKPGYYWVRQKWASSPQVIQFIIENNCGFFYDNGIYRDDEFDFIADEPLTPPKIPDK